MSVGLDLGFSNGGVNIAGLQIGGSKSRGYNTLRSHMRKWYNWIAPQEMRRKLDYDQDIRDRNIADIRRGFVEQVRAARDTGMHPLFALGSQPYSGGGGQPIPVGTEASGGPVGSSGNSIRARGPSPTELASIDESAARAQYYRALAQKEYNAAWAFEDSKTARKRQMLNASQDASELAQVDQVEIVPATQTSAKRGQPHLQAGSGGPGLQKLKYGPKANDYILIPDQDKLESGEIVGLVTTIMANVNRRDRRIAMEKRRRKSMSTRHAPYPKPRGKRKYVPRSSGPYRSKYPSHHYR